MTQTTEQQIWTIAQAVCTPNELQALDHRYRRNLSHRHAALTLGISVSALRDRLTNAHRKIQNELERQANAAA